MVVFADNYGDNDNFSLPLQNAIKELKDGDELRLTNKEYHFYRDFSPSMVVHMTNTDSFNNPKKYFGILLDGLNNVTVNGNGAVLHIHGDMCALALLNCSGIVLKNFSIYYPSPSNVEFCACKISDNSVIYRLSSSEFKVCGKSITFFEKSPFSNKEYFSFTDNQMTDCWVCHDDNKVYRVWNENSPLSNIKSIKSLKDNKLEIEYYAIPNVKCGAVYSISPNHNRHTSGIFFSECSNIESKNIEINYLAGFGWLSQMCNGLSFEDICFLPASGRSVSSFADGIHICGCKGRVRISNCLFSHLHDDGINIHSAFLRTKKILSNSSAVFEFVHNQQGGYAPFFIGNKARFYNRKDLSPIGSVYTVKKVESIADQKCVVLEFEETLPPLEEKMSVIENITFNPEVEISDCVFKAIPTRGILCTTDKKAEIYNNIFENIKMACIYISCDCREWYEGGPCREMYIHNNKFSKENAVVIEPLCLEQPVSDVHRNIKIYDNIVCKDNYNDF